MTEKTYPCYECEGRLHKWNEFKDEDGRKKNLWHCDKCDGIFTVSIPYKFTAK